MGIADRTAYLLANPKELEAFVIAAEKNADDWLALNHEAQVLVEFAKTAPGRLPSRVQEAIAHVSGMPVDGGLCNCRDRCTGACCPKPAAGVKASHADETMRLAAEFAAAHAEWLYGPEEKQAENYAMRAAAVGALRTHVRRGAPSDEFGGLLQEIDAAGVRTCGTCKHKAQPLGHGPCRGCRYSGCPNWEPEVADGVMGTPAPLGWLYDWTHSSALGKPDEHFTVFTTDEARAKAHDNARPVYGEPPNLNGRDRALIRTAWEFSGASKWIDEDTIAAILRAHGVPVVAPTNWTDDAMCLSGLADRLEEESATESDMGNDSAAMAWACRAHELRQIVSRMVRATSGVEGPDHG